MRKILMTAALFILVLNGCASRSISDSGYKGGYYYGHNSFYKGELSEFDVLGIDAGKEYTEEQISDELNRQKEQITLKKGDSVLLVQSGAIMPDEEMIQSMERYFSISVFTGIPEEKKGTNFSYSNSLRYSAAKGGIEKIFVYWGILESGTRNLATKTVSWVPIIGQGIPDESQEMRIRLKVALIDVKTGQWEIFTPEVFQDSASSARANRAESDQEQVLRLKSVAYKSAVQAIVNRYMK